MMLTTPLETLSRELVFSGGPDGGTFKYFARGITDYSNAKLNITIRSEPSAGSVENMKKVNNRVADLGITYSGDLYLGRNGFLLGKRSRQYRNVYALSYLYGAPAHLVVLKSSGINSIFDLAFGKRIAIGKVGSGSATAAQRLFDGLKIWSKIQPRYIGFNEGAEALMAKQVDALWVFAGFPNSAVTRVASMGVIKLLHIHKDVEEKSDFFADHPFYSKVIIPSGTYHGVDYNVATYQDSTLLTAGKNVSADAVEKILETIYTPDGLAYLVRVKSTAKDMSIDSGLTGIVTPLHRGAMKFWKSKGKILNSQQTK